MSASLCASFPEFSGNEGRLAAFIWKFFDYMFQIPAASTGFKT